jgi:signal transduction histidine kinase
MYIKRDKSLLKLLRTRGEIKIDVYIWIVNHRRRYNPGVIIATGATLAIVPLLAYLQYQWLGQLSEREAERMRANVRMAAFRCSMDFSQELTGLMKSLAGPLRGSDDEVRNELRERIQRWKESSTHPKLATEDIALSPLPQAESLSSVAIDEQSSLYLANDLTTIAIPIQGRPHIAGIISLNREQMTSSYLPELIRTNFGADGSLAYDFMIVDRNGLPFFRQTKSATAGQFGQPDVSISFLSFPPQPLSRMPSGQPPDRMPYGPRPNASRGPEEPMPEQPGNDRQPPMMQGPGGQQGEDRRMRPQGLYEFRIFHRDGTLEAAVDHIRLRNLAISFGVLLLLGGSIIFLLLSASRARRLARQQLEFVAGISHELRTPIAVLKSVGENLSDGVVHNADHARQYGALIKTEVARLSEMVEQALAYASIQSGKRAYEHQPVDIADVVEEALHEAQKRAAIYDVTIDTLIVPNLPEVIGDGAALRSAMENLVTNALKYGGEKKWIGVEARLVSRDQSQHLEITVTDRGIGIPAEDLPKVFDPFFRAQNAVDGQVQGSGLGLNITKHIVEAHGGTIAVTSSTEEGTSFAIRLPVERRQGEQT